MFRILFRLLGIGLGLCLMTTGHASFPKPPTPKHLSTPRISRVALHQRARKAFTKRSFVKDVVRKKAKSSEYLKQFKEAKEIHERLKQQPPGTRFNQPKRDALIQQLDDLTLVDDQTLQLWKGILTYRKSFEVQQDMAQYFQDYFGFDTPNDVSLLPENALEEAPLIQELQEIYRDFTERFTQFVETNRRLPRLFENTGKDNTEAILSQEYEFLLFMNPYYRFEPFEQYIQQIEEAVLKFVQ